MWQPRPAERTALYSLVGLDVPDADTIREDAEQYRVETARGRDGRFRIDVVVTAYQHTCALTGYRLTTGPPRKARSFARQPPSPARKAPGFAPRASPLARKAPGFARKAPRLATRAFRRAPVPPGPARKAPRPGRKAQGFAREALDPAGRASRPARRAWSLAAYGVPGFGALARRVNRADICLRSVSNPAPLPVVFRIA